MQHGRKGGGRIHLGSSKEQLAWKAEVEYSKESNNAAESNGEKTVWQMTGVDDATSSVCPHIRGQ